MSACEKTTQTAKNTQTFCSVSFTNICILNKGRDKAQTILTKIYLLPQKEACRVDVTHRNVVKTHKTYVVVELMKSAKRI